MVKENPWQYYYIRQTQWFCVSYGQFSFHLWQHPFSTSVWCYISQLIRYARACRDHTDFLYRTRLLIIRFFEHGYVASRLKSSLQKFYGRHHELVDRYGIAICTTRTDLSPYHSFHYSVYTPDMTFLLATLSVFLKCRGRLPYRCIWSMLKVLLESGLLICACYFAFFMFFVVSMCFSCLDFILWVHSFDYSFKLTVNTQDQISILQENQFFFQKFFLQDW